MATIVAGKALADKEMDVLRERYLAYPGSVVLSIITCAPNRATRSYLALKEKIATTLGVQVSLIELPRESSTDDICDAVQAASSTAQGIIVQLPLPSQIDVSRVLMTIPPSHDVDVFSYAGESTTILPPVVGAIDLIAKAYAVTWVGKQVVVLGAGRLVGSPAALFAQSQGAEVTALTEASAFSVSEREIIIKSADIIILGVGQARLLRADMVKEGVVIFDAGASEDGGVLVGDADPAVADRASLLTPVPGGIGPLTIMILFRNLLDLANRQ